MKAISVLLIFSCAGVTWGQLAGGNVSFDGLSISYETRLEPPLPGIARFGGGVITEKNVIKRHLCDFAQKKYFGYDLTLEPLKDGLYLLRFSPLSITPQKMSQIFPEAIGWALLPLPQNPATQILIPGDTLALDLFLNPASGQKIVEYIRMGGGKGDVVTASGPARDFTIEDGRLEISSPRLKINAKPQPEYRGGVAGSPVWLYVPGRGRFVFSLAPRHDLGFLKAGEVRGSTLTWRWGSDEYSVSTDKRIAPGDGAYTLYVFNDLNYRPKPEDANTTLVLGAVGTLESLVKR